MSYYEKESNAIAYIKMAEGYDGRELVKELRQHLEDGSHILEIGMGPGKDLDLLSEYFTVTGTDISEVFLDMYRSNHPDADLMLLDAVTLETDRKFDAIYSNKVLQHLKTDKLIDSIHRQKELLHEDGLVMHAFWKGSGSESFDGLFFQYYSQKDLADLFSPGFEIIKIEVYSEMDMDDSLLVLAKNR
jgi:cyclopropane fatty-acyl-phospholipid synthase-like methyltransferase